MTAAALSQHFKDQSITITLVESSVLGTVGVGEATIPTLRCFCHPLGYSDADIIKATNATCKLGIEFQDWYQLGSRFIHPFGLFGQGTKDVPFHHYWLRAKQHGHEVPLSAYSLGASLAK
ncbi:MAG: tryptophan 7-halogenase, partial [Pseudoalteromonas prydzensis]